MQKIAMKNAKTAATKTAAKSVKPSAKKTGVAAIDSLIDNAEWVQQYGDGGSVGIAPNVVGSRRPLTTTQIAFVLQNEQFCSRLVERYPPKRVGVLPDN